MAGEGLGECGADLLFIPLLAEPSFVMRSPPQLRLTRQLAFQDLLQNRIRQICLEAGQDPRQQVLTDLPFKKRDGVGHH